MAIDFSPVDGTLVADVDGCAGTLRLRGMHPLTNYRFEANVSAKPSELRRCLGGPSTVCERQPNRES